MPRLAFENCLVEQLRQHKVLTMPQLRQHCRGSHMRVFRALRRLGYHTSYNRNGVYYTLAEIPQFDRRGLWQFGEARFSRDPTLAATLVRLIEKSPAGYRADELEQQLGTRVQNHLRELTRQGHVQRVKFGPSYVYLAASETRSGEQSRRRGPVGPSEPESFRLPPGISRMTLVRLLLAKIASPEASAATLARGLRMAGETIDAATVHTVFAFYGIAEKKGS
jgi:hypothetical protein